MYHFTGLLTEDYRDNEEITNEIDTEVVVKEPIRKAVKQIIDKNHNEKRLRKMVISQGNKRLMRMTMGRMKSGITQTGETEELHSL